MEHFNLCMLHPSSTTSLPARSFDIFAILRNRKNDRKKLPEKIESERWDVSPGKNRWNSSTHSLRLFPRAPTALAQQNTLNNKCIPLGTRRSLPYTCSTATNHPEHALSFQSLGSLIAVYSLTLGVTAEAEKNAGKREESSSVIKLLSLIALARTFFCLKNK